MGYARAARILDELEEAGIIGPADGSKPRELLVTEKKVPSTMDMGQEFNVFEDDDDVVEEEDSEEEETDEDDAGDDFVEYEEETEEEDDEELLEEELEDEADKKFFK